MVSESRHYVLRGLAIANIAIFVLSFYSGGFYNLLTRWHAKRIILAWMILSSFVLPLYPLAQAKRSVANKVPWFIDAGFGISWFFVFWLPWLSNAVLILYLLG